jgi:Cdc6-like AAA superfamily ATPase
MTGLIIDRQALRPETVPQDLVHRDGQIDALATAFDPLRHGVPGEHVCIFGPTGSGKPPSRST